MKKEYLYKRGAKERVGLTCDTLFWLIAIDGGACEAILIDNLSSMFQTEESLVIIFDTTFFQENSAIQALIQPSFSASQQCKC